MACVLFCHQCIQVEKRKSALRCVLIQIPIAVLFRDWLACCLCECVFNYLNHSGVHYCLWCTYMHKHVCTWDYEYVADYARNAVSTANNLNHLFFLPFPWTSINVFFHQWVYVADLLLWQRYVHECVALCHTALWVPVSRSFDSINDEDAFSQPMRFNK